MIVINKKHIIIDSNYIAEPIKRHIDNVLADKDWVLSADYDSLYKPYYETPNLFIMPITYFDVVDKILTKENITYELRVEEDVFNTKGIEITMPNFPFELHKYQSEVIHTVLNAHYFDDVRRNTGIITCDTNAGKTEMICAIAYSRAEELRKQGLDNNRIIIVSYDGQGVVQTQKRFDAYGVKSSIIEDIKIGVRPNVTICTPNLPNETISLADETDIVSLGQIIIMSIHQYTTFARRLEDWKVLINLDMLLWDEPDKITIATTKAHATWQKKINYYNYAYGFTGTYGLNKPVRRLIISQVVGTPFDSISVKYKQLRELGQSSDVEVIRTPFIEPYLGFNTVLNNFFSVLDYKNDLLREYNNFKHIPYEYVQKYNKQFYKLLKQLPELSAATKKPLHLKYPRMIIGKNIYDIQRDVLAFNKELNTKILKPILNKYLIQYEKDNTLGLLINCTNNIQAIDLLVSIVMDYLRQKGLADDVIVAAGHTKAATSLSKIKQDFQEKKINILVTAAVKHGLSHNNLFGLVNYWGRGTDKLRQLVGRGERKNKEDLSYVFDIDFRGSALSIMSSHSYERLEMFRDIGYRVRKE
jgi:hypothetical protein